MITGIIFDIWHHMILVEKWMIADDVSWWYEKCKYTSNSFAKVVICKTFMKNCNKQSFWK